MIRTARSAAASRRIEGLIGIRVRRGAWLFLESAPMVLHAGISGTGVKQAIWIKGYGVCDRVG